MSKINWKASKSKKINKNLVSDDTLQVSEVRLKGFKASQKYIYI